MLLVSSLLRLLMKPHDVGVVFLFCALLLLGATAHALIKVGNLHAKVSQEYRDKLDQRIGQLREQILRLDQKDRRADRKD